MAESDFIFDHLTKWAQGVTDQIRENLESKDGYFSTSSLAQSIVALPVEKVADGYVLRIQMEDYGKFVDEGRGVTKKKTASINGTVQSKLHGADGWIAKREMPLKLEVQVKKNGTPVFNKDGKPRMQRFENINEANRSLSFAIASKIHKHGYKSKGYGFYSEVVNDNLLNQLSEELAPIAGEMFEVSIINEED